MDLTKLDNFGTYLNKFSSLKEKNAKKHNDEVKEGDRVAFYFNGSKIGEGIFKGYFTFVEEPLSIISTENGTIIGNFIKEIV